MLASEVMYIVLLLPFLWLVNLLGLLLGRQKGVLGPFELPLVNNLLAMNLLGQRVQLDKLSK